MTSTYLTRLAAALEGAGTDPDTLARIAAGVPSPVSVSLIEARRCLETITQSQSLHECQQIAIQALIAIGEGERGWPPRPDMAQMPEPPTEEMT